MKFPRRIYTEEEVRKAKGLIDKGYRHTLRVKGSPCFQQKVKQALELIKTAGYYDFFAAYIRGVEEIDGLTQLRNADAVVWANMYAVENPVDAASFFVQKANQMKEYLDLKHYYSGEAEKRSAGKRVEFLETLIGQSQEKEVVVECERLLKFWRECSLIY